MRLSSRFLSFTLLVVMLSGCTQTQFAAHMFKKISPPDTKSIGHYKVGNPYKIKGRWYHPKEEFRKTETGIASWYGPNFHGKPTANGEVFDQEQLTAAHRTLQMPSIARVTNLENGRSLILRINDRGPFARNRVLDVSKRGAELLGFKRAGTARVKIEVLENESLYAANEAKQGRSTAGLEIALNKGQSLPSRPSGRDAPVILASAQKKAPAKLPVNLKTSGAVSTSSVEREVLQTAKTSADSLTESEKLVKRGAAVATELYVQAGAFSNYGNAARMRTSLSRLGNAVIEEAVVNDQKFFRVRIGPIDNVVRADTVLEALANQGNDQAMIIVQ